jgi:hypothetical protein
MNVTGTRVEIITSPTGTTHAPRRTIYGKYVLRMDWRVTACGQIADMGWSQHRLFGYITCRNCVKWLEEGHDG